MSVVSTIGAGWSRLSRSRKLLIVAGALGVVVGVAATLNYISDNDGLSLIDPSNPRRSYVMVFLLVALDSVVPIFPGETTLNAASTAAAQGTPRRVVFAIVRYAPKPETSASPRRRCSSAATSAAHPSPGSFRPLRNRPTKSS